MTDHKTNRRFKSSAKVERCKAFRCHVKYPTKNGVRFKKIIERRSEDCIPVKICLIEEKEKKDDK